jgi:hypothetical protein
MSSNFNPTETEQQVLTETRHLFGSNLADYLLSGLGEANITQCRAFTAQLTSLQGEDISYRFEIHNESAQGLPMGVSLWSWLSCLVFSVSASHWMTRSPSERAMYWRG